ncbi:MAG: questin oxidase family protein [Senegalia sp. (in: firmicutes)]|uniref:questin oxidase family protein n=1 Tax=Senegalia sp. (in: firmicutes) TaxID=1924098 RepID=UPI003F9E964C
MNIARIINENSQKYSPYNNGLVNHLPMGQFALYKLTNNIEKTEEYTKNYLKKSNIDKVKEEYKKVNTIEECLGKRDLYEGCLELIREISKNEDIEELVSFLLNKYPLGLSSGLFHTTIRLAYAIEGYKEDSEIKSEVERALSYYITAYRKGGLFKRKIEKENSLEEMYKLMQDEKLKEIRNSDISLGQKLKKLYNSEKLLRQGFIIEGSEKDKVDGILKVLIPAFYNTNNIVMLHCITGLQAVVTLKEYFKDYEMILDIFTTTAIAHLLTQGDLDIRIEDTKINQSWEEIKKSASKSTNVHTLKFAYSANKLDNIFDEKDLKYATYKRIELEK